MFTNAQMDLSNLIVLKMRLLARLGVPFYTNVRLFCWNNNGNEIRNFTFLFG